MRSVLSVSVVSVAIAERSLIYFARVAGQGLRSISIAGRRKSKGQLRSPQTHGPAHGCKSVGACAYGEMLRQQSWIHRSRTNRSRTVVLERRSDTCSCGWKLLILTDTMKSWPDPYFRKWKIKVQQMKPSVSGVCWQSKNNGTTKEKTVLNMWLKKHFRL